MKNLYRQLTNILFLIVFISSYSQNPTGPAMPTIIPPSPTVANLMNFEEVPVDNYTGQPDISIPLYSKQLNSDITIPIVLKYSTMGVRIEQRSGWTGTGWSLDAGGTISRTIRGIADETLPDNYNNKSTGVSNLPDFWNFEDLPTYEQQHEFLWNVNGTPTKKYDSQPDLYQFSALGISGRFIIDGNMQAKLLTQDSKLKIIVNSPSLKIVTGFVIIDPNGYKYTFNAIETTTSTSVTMVKHRDDSPTAPEHGYPQTNNSAWHLTSIKNSNDVELVTFSYTPNAEEYSTPISRTEYNLLGNTQWDGALQNDYSIKHFKPKSVNSKFDIIAQTLKLTQIDFKDGSKLNFILSADGIHPETQGMRLNGINLVKVNGQNQTIDREFSFAYQLTANDPFIADEDENPRLWLTQLSVENESYQFEYFEKDQLPDFNGPSDGWGYNYADFRASNEYGFNYYDFNAFKRGLLTSITYPTGGVKQFSWAPHTFSYEGATLIDNFDSNPYNSTNEVFTHQFTANTKNTGTQSPGQSITFTHDQYIQVELPSLQGATNFSHLFEVKFTKPGTSFSVDINSLTTKMFITAGTYTCTVRIKPTEALLDLHTIYGAVNIQYVKRKTGDAYGNYLLGGGVRINNIRFIEPLNQGFPERIVNYSYGMTEPNGFFGSINISSGAIDAKIGNMRKEYGLTERKYIFMVPEEISTALSPRNITYDVVTNEPNVHLSKGNYVGYKKVKIINGTSFNGMAVNGFTEYTYDTARDYPSNVGSFQYPYIEPLNIDYKRGLLRHKATYNKDNVLLEETLNKYGYHENLIAKTFTVTPSWCEWTQFYNEYSQYSLEVPPLILRVLCIPEPMYDCIDDYNKCGIAPYLYHSVNLNAGRAELDTVVSKKYFYNGSVQSMIESTTTYDYNLDNYQLSEEITTISEGSSSIEYKTTYEYPVGEYTTSLFPDPTEQAAITKMANTLNMVNKPLVISSYKSDALLQRVVNKYKEFANNQILIKEIETIKGGLPANILPEDRITYHNYDARGNVLDVSATGGMRTKYIYGYNNTLPVAKIDNMPTAIPGNHLTAINVATATTMQAAVDNLQNDPALAGAQITTATYDICKGITSTTDTKGYRHTYEYDNLARLLRIKDAANNFLSSYNYHYRTQSPFSAIGTSSQNHVVTTTYRYPGSNVNTARRNITYLDALGRTIQQISGKASATGKDIITHIEYDAYGRQSREYLPYAGSGTNLAYDTIALANTQSFYNTTVFENTANPYSEKFFEPSPLNRVLKQGAPGNVWQGSATNDNDHTVKFTYLTNAATDNVKRLQAGAIWSDQYKIYLTAFFSQSTYPSGQLYKTVTKDENWVSGLNNTTEEYTNQQGQVVLKRGYNNSVAHDTYYVYDQFGNLTYVLPPKANGSSTYLNDLCYQYRYDARNRLVEKKLPGKEWEFIVYDNLDRVIATGPALSPFGSATESGWMYTYYDVFNRVAFTGWASGAASSSIRQTKQSNTSIINVVRGEGQLDTPQISLNYKIDFTPPANFRLLTVNYYDDYAFPGSPAPPASSVENQTVLLNVKGLPTGSWSRVLTTAGETFGHTAYTYYDTKGRAIRTRTTNYLSGYTETNSKLDFLGKPSYTITRHKRTAADTELVTRDDFSYTDQDRLLTHSHKINALPSQLMSYNFYDEIGQLEKKYTGGPDLTGVYFYQEVNYTYNIRGWLKGINDVLSLASTSNMPTDLFAFKINYNETINNNIGNEVKPLYNGNIAETSWRTSADNKLRRYGYKYDNLNRLSNAYYQKPNDAVPVTNSYNESLTYDTNGNIMSLQRNGELDDATTTFQIDNLTYIYPAGSNKLAKVTDSTNHPRGFQDSSDNNGNDYAYDGYGNMVSDKNKGITAITYNHLNLPVEISFSGTTTKKINYIYDATGVKVKKTITEGAVVVNVDYLDGGYQYKNDVLQFFPTAEGYVDYTPASRKANEAYNYVYQYKDHLGNVRVNYALTIGGSDWEVSYLAIKEENHYYPFGLKHGNYNMSYLEFQEMNDDIVLYPPLNTSTKLMHNYKYLGQERQDELGLNWDTFRYRNYDYAIGRFFGIDPISEEFVDISTYQFAHNNPVWKVELEGLEGIPFQNLLNSAADGVGNFFKNTASGLKNEAVGLVNAYKNIPTNPVATLKYAAGKSGPALIYKAVKGQIERPINIIQKAASGDINGVVSAYTEHLTEGVVAMATAGVVKGGTRTAASRASTGESVAATAEAPVTNQIYKRPNNATTPGQRASVQGEPCVSCGEMSTPMVADHKIPLVQEHYQTGTINTQNMRSLEAVQPQCTTCSSRQGAQMSQYSKEMKSKIQERTAQ